MLYPCPHCDKSFSSPSALKGHSRVHKAGHAEAVARQGAAHTERGRKRQEALRAQYQACPQLCRHCSAPLSYEDAAIAKKQFCNSSCAAAGNNALRGGHSPETRAKIAESTRQAHRAKPQKPPATPKAFLRRVEGPFCKLITCRCAHCDKAFVARQARKYCDEHANLYGREGRYQFAFAFNPFDYPDIFSTEDLRAIQAKGFWNPANPNGLTRDHKVSVNSAIREGLDAFYIRHPLNCELLPWLENNRKKTANSITYEELMAQVDAYEAKKTGSVGRLRTRIPFETDYA